MEPGRSLTRRQFDEVIRRAAELAAHDSEAGELSEGELYRIAGEVGLPEQHVRRALSELRTRGIPRPFGAARLDRIFGAETVLTSRVVPGRRDELRRILDDFLVAGQLLQPVRRGDRVLQYQPAVDWVSQIARAASSTSRRYYVASAKSVDVRLEDVERDGHTLVEIEVDPGTRGDSVAGAVLGGIFGGGGGGVLAGMAVAAVAPLTVAVVVGAVVTGAATAGLTWAVGRSHRNKLAEVRAEVEGVLDRLETGESLDPPPPSWRRWVKRQFHGARKLVGDELDSPDEGA
ncbi:MAG TPA: hypothetical protein VGA70_09380 [Longimicrobiales bacterium]|jgi:hypothetical protein